MRDSIDGMAAFDSSASNIDRDAFSSALVFAEKARRHFEACADRLGSALAQTYDLLGKCHLHLEQPATAIEFHRQALQLRLAMPKLDSSAIANSYNNLGALYLNEWENKEAIAYFERSLAMRRAIYGEKHEQIGQVWHNLGIAYYNLGDYAASLNCYHQAIAIDEAVLAPFDANLSFDYMNTATVYDEIGDYDRAIDLYLKALNIRLKAYGDKSLRVASVLNNLGVAYDNKGKLEAAESCYRRALQIRQQAPDPPQEKIAETKNNLAEIFIATSRLDSAMHYLQAALSLRLRVLAEDNPYIAESYHNIGRVFALQHRGDSALFYYSAAYRHARTRLGLEHPYTAFYAKALGDALAGQHAYDRAVAAYDTALVSLGYPVKRLDQISSLAQYQAILTAKAATLNRLARRQNDPALLRQSEQMIGRAVETLQQRRLHFGRISSKETLYAQSFPTYEAAIENALLQTAANREPVTDERLFAWAEQSKSLALTEHLRAHRASLYGKVPDSVLQVEYRLKTEISFVERSRREALEEGAAIGDSVIAGFDHQYVALREQYEALIAYLEKDFPDYYRLKYDFAVESVAAIQRNQLSADEALLEYFVGDSSIFLFLVRKNDYRVIPVKRDFPLDSLVWQLRHGIYGYHTVKNAPQALLTSTTGEYIAAATELYTRLLAPVASLLPRRVIIVPDGILGYIPFEALLAERPAYPSRFHTYVYFGHGPGAQHSVSYCYSATLLHDMSSRRHRQAPPQAFLGYAPFFDGDTTLLASRFVDPAEPARQLPFLIYAAEEVEALQRLLGGKAVIGKSAREASFVGEAAGFRILHLSTHGKADDRAGDQSFLAFSEIRDSLENEWLYVSEIYNLGLNADLVVLSACETGIGELKHGEGIISLARAFAYAGAKSIITTLWSVNDARTKDFMLLFYHNLKQGRSKDDALAQARADYFAAYPGLDAHPFFWAGFIAIGDMSPVFER
jgi:CHAT domain-containing protein/Tfp pilus assembly protein PilF